VDGASDGRIAARSISIRGGQIHVKCRGCNEYQPFPGTVTLEAPAPSRQIVVSLPRAGRTETV
jgi:hypothetical protein